MHIIAACPFCQTSYQVQQALRGQAIRCPNASCRKVFMIAPEPPAARPPAAPASAAPPSKPPGSGNQQSGSVGDMVPILPAEQASPPAVSAPPSRPVSDRVPPVPAEPATSDAEPKPADGDWWQGPPSRQASSPPAARPSAAPSPPPAARPAAAPPPPAATPVASPGQAPWWGEAPPPVRAPQARAEAAPAPTPRRGRRSEEPQTSAPPRPTKESSPRPVSRTQPMPTLVPEKSDQPRELPPGAWEAPPVRRGAEAATAQESPLEETHRPVVSKRRARWLIALMILVPLGVIGGVGVPIWFKVQQSEEKRFATALSEYEQGHYSEAASKLRELAEKFPNSEHAAEYRFLQEWSNVCGTAADPGDNLAGAVEKLDAFIKEHKKDPLMVKYGHDAGQLLLRLSSTFADSNAAPTSPRPLADADHLEQLRRTIQGLGPDALSQAESAQVEGDLGKVRLAVDRWRKRGETLSELHQRKKETPFDALKRALALLKQKERVVPGIGEDAEARAALTKLYDAHMASVVYHPHGENGKGGAPRRAEDDAASLLFTPRTSGAPGNAPADDPIILALARGVLYALKQSNGELKWATRVGIDTTVLPLRVPARLGRPELYLVLSADTQTLTALDANGSQEWEYHIGQPVLGRPVIIDQLAYLAAYDGSVHEIELSEGKPLGRYSLGQRLTCGGAREGDSKRIYFPADDSCIYVLDVEQKKCINILYDGHPGGSLRSEPIIIAPERRDAGEPGGLAIEAAETPGYLILNQASGLDAMSLRVFQLPIQDRNAAPLNLKPPARLNGWTWFEPYHDSEKLAVLTDAGVLGLFGIRQVGNKDQALFPLLQPGGLDLSPFLHGGANAPPARGRSQVVHVQGNELWMLAHGRLQQLEILWDNPVGPRAVAGWPKPRSLGSPLHAPQRLEDHNGRSTFFLVTQPLDQQTCIASAVDDEGHILWQRQLGLVFQGEPLALTPPQGGEPVLLALDQGGGLFTLDPTQPNRSRSIWQSVPNASALEDNPRFTPRLLPASDGHTAYELAASSDGTKLLLRRVEWEGEGHRLRARSLPEISLASAEGTAARVPAGAPTLVGTQLIVPRAEGDLLRVFVAMPEKQGQRKGGPSWRSDRAAPSAPCHLLALGGDRFLASDGSRGLNVWEWPSEGEWRGLPVGRGDQPTLELAYPVAVPPVLLPSKEGPPRVLVADSAGTLQLLTLAADGSLQPTRTWRLPGRLSAAPFVRKLVEGGVRIGCLVEERQLIWLDPARDEPLWTYRTDGETIVGSPHLIEGLMVVALQSGRYVGLDPATGKASGAGYTLRASAAPAASPLSFGPGRMLTPLSDGTALLLSPKLLREPKR